MNPPAPTVFIVDDDLSIREALTSLIRSAGLRVIAFASGPEFLRQARGEHPACLVLDIRLPDMSGFELQRALVDLGEPMPVIFITGHGDIPMSVRAMKAGAIDFLPKPFRDDQLLASIHHALELDRLLRTADQYTTEVRRRFDTLTNREREVMAHVVKGLRNKQIAATLRIAEITIKVHRRRVMQKMKAASLAELVRMDEKLAPGYT